MKGGSATKMILEVVFARAIAAAFGATPLPPTPRALCRLPAAHRDIANMLACYERATRMVYMQVRTTRGVMGGGARAHRPSHATHLVPCRCVFVCVCVCV